MTDTEYPAEPHEEPDEGPDWEQTSFTEETEETEEYDEGDPDPQHHDPPDYKGETDDPADLGHEAEP